MDTKMYDPSTRALIDKMLDQKRNMDKDVLQTMKRLMRVARASGDNRLIGFAHFHMADALYAFEIDYTLFRKHLAKAINHLQLAEDTALLARAYNYVGVDALNNSCFDVAYFYFMNSLQTCEKLDNDYLKSLGANNIGQVFARMRSNAKALKYVRDANRLQQRGAKDDIYYYQNMINGYFSEGVLCIALDDLEGAKRIDRKIAQLEKKVDNPEITSVQIPVVFLRLQIALLDGDKERVKELSPEAIRVCSEAHRIYDFITDIEDLCGFLLERGHIKLAREILDAIRPTIEKSGVLQMSRILTSLEITYSEKIGDKDALIYHLHEQHKLAEEQIKEQNRIYQYSIDLINIMDDLRKEREQMREENASLQEQAQTDVLTGIPNRLALDGNIDAALRRAKDGGYPFGIAMLDVDHFKEYNDTYGHQAGDDCLQKVAKELQTLSSQYGVFCARYGGDEFVILFENMDDAKVLQFAQNLEKGIRALNIRHSGAGKQGRISVSQGICNCVPGKKNLATEYLAEADTALYAIKKNLDHRHAGESARLVHLPD